MSRAAALDSRKGAQKEQRDQKRAIEEYDKSIGLNNTVRQWIKDDEVGYFVCCM